MTDPDYSGLPDELSVLVTRHWQRFQEVGHVLPDALLKDLPRVWAGSDYVAEQFIRDADLGDWLAGCALKARLEPGRLGEEISQAVMACDDEDALKATLRRLRHRHMVRLIWRDLTGLADYHATVADLSLLADTLIATALEKLYQWACERNGTPRDEQGRPVKLVVLAMGKLGARELNLSSDIDLIFAYEDEGEIEGERRNLTHHQFFLRLGQQLIKALDQTTGDGFVFRVDMRLRPWGKKRRAGGGLRRHGKLLRKPGPRMGALRADQDAPGGRRPGRRRAPDRTAQPLCVPPLYRLRRVRIPARNERADRTRGEPQGHAGGRSNWAPAASAKWNSSSRRFS